MNAPRRLVAAAITVLVLLVGTACYLEAAQQRKPKPRNAVTLQDSTGRVEKPAGYDSKGKALKTYTTIRLKYYLHIDGWFDADGLNVEFVQSRGPATKMKTVSGSSTAIMEPGDIIVAVDGNPVTTPNDYADAMNTAGANNPNQVMITVRDCNSGNDRDYFVKPHKH